MAGSKLSLAPGPSPLAREAALEAVALAAVLLLDNGQTTEQTVLATERLGRALGTPIRVLPYWGGLAVQSERTLLTEIAVSRPIGVDMRKVLAVMTVVDQVCDGALPAEAARPALIAAGQTPPVSTARLVVLAAVGAAAMAVIFGALDPTALLLIAASAGAGALVRRGLARLGGNPFVQPLCAAAIAGAVAAGAARLQLPDAQILLVALSPGMVLVPGPHILNGAIDLARSRITLGLARLAYAGLIVLMICVGLLAGLAAGGATLPSGGASASVPLRADVLAAGCAVAAFGSFFSMPWRLLPFPMVVGMVAHAVRWGLIAFAGAHVAFAALVACLVVGVIVTPVVDRLRLPFAAAGFSAVVSMMPGFFLFHAAGGLIELVSARPNTPASVLDEIVTNGATAFLIILAMTFGLILPRMLFEHFLRESAPRRPHTHVFNSPSK
jgi:uncharacterized membrane protein YjjP (DUF1212 family)